MAVGTYSPRRNHGRVTASRQTEKTVDTQHWRVDWLRIHSAKGDVTRSSTMEKKDIAVVVCCRQPSSRKVDYSEWVSFMYTFFSQTRAQVIPVDGFLRAIAQKTSNHARMCRFGVWTVPLNFGGKIPKNWNFGGVNRTFNLNDKKI